MENRSGAEETNRKDKRDFRRGRQKEKAGSLFRVYRKEEKGGNEICGVGGDAEKQALQRNLDLKGGMIEPTKVRRPNELGRGWKIYRESRSTIRGVLGGSSLRRRY